MTTTDLIYEFARDRLPGLVRDIVREEMRDLLSKIPCERAVWECTWCGYKNIRINAGLDHCSVCGSEVMTYFMAAGDLRVRYAKRPPDRCRNSSRRGRNKATGEPHTRSTTSYQGPK